MPSGANWQQKVIATIHQTLYQMILVRVEGIETLYHVVSNCTKISMIQRITLK